MGIYKLKILTSAGIYEEVDVKPTIIPLFPIIDENRITGEFSLRIENELPNDADSLFPKTLLLIININPSVFLNAVERFYIECTVQNSFDTKITSDKFSFEGQGYVGILFSSDPDVISNYSNNPIVFKKIILFPYSILPQSSIDINFKIYNTSLENISSIIRNKFFRYERLLYDVSKSYTGFLESYFGTNLSRFYTTYGRGNSFLLYRKEALVFRTFFPKDFFFAHLLANPVIVLENGTLDSLVLKYEKNVLSNYQILNTSTIGLINEEFKYSPSSGVISSSIENKSVSSIEYLKQIAYLVLAELTKPYLENSGYSPTNAKENLEKIIQTVLFLLNTLKTLNLKERIENNYSSLTGSPLPATKQKTYFVLFYLLGIFLESFSKNLITKNYISSLPSNLSDLVTFLENNFITFLDWSAEIGKSSTLDEELLETDILFAFLLHVLLAHASGKNIFSDNKPQIFLGAIYGYYINLSKFIHLVNAEIDPNTETVNVQNFNREKYFNKLTILALLSTVFLEEFMFFYLESRLNSFIPQNFSLQSYYRENMDEVTIELLSLSSSPNLTLTETTNSAIIFPGNNSEILSFDGKTVAIASNPSLQNIEIILSGNIFSTKIENNTLKIKFNKNEFLYQSDFKIIKPIALPKDLHANLIHSYLKLLGVNINGNYYISGANSATEELAFVNILIYEYIKTIYSAYINNKVSQNVLNIKFILTTAI